MPQPIFDLTRCFFCTDHPELLGSLPYRLQSVPSALKRQNLLNTPCQAICCGDSDNIGCQSGYNVLMAAHGTSTEYRNGCRCAVCKAGNTQRQRDYQARRSTPASPNVVEMPGVSRATPEIGFNEAAVIAQCENAPKAGDLPSIVAQARTLARILDDPSLMTYHATTSRQLQSLLATLQGPPKKSRGRLAAVQAMTANRNARQAQ